MKLSVEQKRAILRVIGEATKDGAGFSAFFTKPRVEEHFDQVVAIVERTDNEG